VDKWCWICLLKKNDKGKSNLIGEVSRHTDMLVVCVVCLCVGLRA